MDIKGNMPETIPGNIGKEKRQEQIGGKLVSFYGDAASRRFFLQPVDEHDAELMESEAGQLEALCGHRDWCILTIPVASWNQELTPWENAPVFGKEGFGSGAPDTLAYLLDEVLPYLDRNYPAEGRQNCQSLPTEGRQYYQSFPAEGRQYFLCGYSLAGLFALWSAYQTDAFAGAAAVSPSVWYPGWREYAQTHTVRARSIYLSLGKKEEKAKNKVMAAVGDAIRDQYSLLTEAGVPCELEWNEGNHFVDSDKRMAKGLAWLLKNGK